MSNGDIFMIPKTSQQKDKIKNFKRNMTNGIPNDFLLLLNIYNYCETLSPNERYRWCLTNDILPEKIEYARVYIYIYNYNNVINSNYPKNLEIIYIVRSYLLKLLLLMNILKM